MREITGCACIGNTGERFHHHRELAIPIESTKTTSIEDVSTGVLEKNKEYLRSKKKAKNDMMYQDIYSCICQNTKQMKIYYPVCQTYSPTGV